MIHEIFFEASTIEVNGLMGPASLEVLAWSEALSLAFDLNLSKVRVATNCCEVVGNVREENPCAYGAIVKEFIIKKN